MTDAAAPIGGHGPPGGGGAPLRPAGAVTGVGSLPIDDPDEAIEFVRTFAPIYPFCPQPPAMELVDVTLAQLEDRGGRYGAGFEHFRDAARCGAFPAAEALKTQITGPITLSGLLGIGRSRSLSTSSQLRHLAEEVARLAEWQLSQLRPAGLPVIVCLDEPAIVLVTETAHDEAWSVIEGVLERIRRAGGRPAVHCCSLYAPGDFLAHTADVVSFDATRLEALTPDDRAVLDRPRQIVSFGCVPTEPPLREANQAFSNWISVASQTGDPSGLARRTLVTSTCGLGRADLAFAEASFGEAAKLGALIRRLAISSEQPPPGSRSAPAQDSSRGARSHEIICRIVS